MANAVVSLVTNGVTLEARAIMLLPISVVLSSTTYATASGGITVDFSGIIRQPTNTLSSIQGYYGAGTSEGGSTRFKLEWTDVIDQAFGTYSGGDTVVPTKSATYGQFTVRLFNGETETADGAKTGTLKLFVPAYWGSHNYQST